MNRIKNFAIKAAGVVVVFCALAFVIHRDNQETQARIRAEKAAEWKKEVEAASAPIFIKPWDNYIECGIQRHDLRACDMRNWPGQVYPDEPIEGEKSPGIVWSCSMDKNPNPRLPPRKVCYADASDERKRAYPCPELATTGSALSSDEHCVAANDRHSRMLRGEGS